MKDYLEVNRKSWNNRTDIHMESEFYGMEAFLNGKTSLKEIEIPLLGDLNGMKVLHLQCHFGQDSISLSRMGAKVTGVDLSDKAISRAKDLALRTKSNVSFICCDIFDLPQHLDEKFDVVFATYGTIGWLPDMEKWASIVSMYLKKGGKFVFAEFHPVVWMFDDNFSKVSYNYFNDGPIKEIESGTYAEKGADIQQEFVMWNHSMSDVVQNLLKHDLALKTFSEYDYSPYNCFNLTEEFEPGKFRIKHLENRIPMVYALTAQKNS